MDHKDEWAIIKVGSRVLQHRDGFTYKGTVEQIETNRKDGKSYYVRWHRGFASWQHEGGTGIYAFRELGSV